jgi:hypothetical protein
MENVRETEEYILVEHASGSGRTFEVGYPKRSGYSRKGIEEEIAHARERRGTEASPDSATYHSLEWAADGASTTTREAISAGLIGGHVDKVSGATYEYQLTFANRSGWSFTFVDLTGDTYTCTTLRNGTHTISYNSAKPTIVGVQ